MHIPASDPGERENVAVQVQPGVHLDGGLVPAKLRHGNSDRHRSNGGRTQSIRTLLQIDAKRIAGVQRLGDANQYLREIGEDSRATDASIGDFGNLTIGPSCRFASLLNA
jgi:hypothetical protein